MFEFNVLSSGSLFIIQLCHVMVSRMLRDGECTIQKVYQDLVRAMMNLKQFNDKLVYITPDTFGGNLGRDLILQLINRQSAKQLEEKIRGILTKMKDETGNMQKDEHLPGKPRTQCTRWVGNIGW